MELIKTDMKSLASEGEYTEYLVQYTNKGCVIGVVVDDQLVTAGSWETIESVVVECVYEIKP